MNYRQEMLRALTCRDPKQNILDSADGLLDQAKFLYDQVNLQIDRTNGMDRKYLIKKLCLLRYHMEVLLASIGGTMEEVEVESVEYLKKLHPTTKVVTDEVQGGFFE